MKLPRSPATDDLGTLGGSSSTATHINAFGQVVGYSALSGDPVGVWGDLVHAFRTGPNLSINPSTDDLGTLGGAYSRASSIDNFGQVVGLSNPNNYLDDDGTVSFHPFIYSGRVMYDLNNLVPAGSNCVLVGTDLYADRGPDINDAGQIVTNGNCGGQTHAVRLDPIYKAFVRQAINADGSSVFSARRGVIPVKFAITQYGTQPSCTLPATIGIVKAGNGTLAAVDESAYSMSEDSGSNFRIDSTACQYVYNLAASALEVGTYRVDISIKGIMVGHAVFALK